MVCRLKKEYASYYIKQLFDSNFGRKPRKSRALTPTSSTRHLLLGTSAVSALLVLSSPTPSLLAPAPFISPSPTLSLLVPAPTNTLIYAMQPPNTETTSEIYMQPSRLTTAAYIQPSSIETLLAAYIQ